MTTLYTFIDDLINTNLYTGIQITAEDHREVEKALLDFAERQWLTGDIKEIDCTQTYIDDPANFIQSGTEKGKGTVGGPREGWAICNGLNTTKDRTGRVSVGYGTVQPPFIDGIQTYPTVGDIGGSKDAWLIAHTHTPQQLNGSIPSQFYQTSWYSPATGGTMPEVAGISGGLYFNNDVAGGFRRKPTTASAGSGDGLGKNMQPYIVTLFIQKL